MASLDATKDLIRKALSELEAQNGEPTPFRLGGVAIKGPYYTTHNIVNQIHGLDPWHWNSPGRLAYDNWLNGGRKGRPPKSPSPSRDRVVKAINQMRRDGEVEYDPSSLGQESRWRLSAA